MSKRVRRENLEFSEGESVIGYYQGWPYPATIERIFPTGSLQKGGPGNLYLLRWTGFSGKKALGLVRQAQLDKNDFSASEKKRALEAARKAGDSAALANLSLEISQINSNINAPLEVFHKAEFPLIFDLFDLPQKLKSQLIAKEESVMQQEHPIKIEKTVSQILREWIESGTWKFEDAEKFSKSLVCAFNKVAMTSLLYPFELPARIAKSSPADSLGADELLRLLSLFPEIASTIFSTKSLDRLPEILELSKGFNSLCDFLSGNFKSYFSSVSQDEGIYYLPKETARVPVVAGILGKRKKPNGLAKRIQ